jgi:hypothetical protein
MAALAAVSTGVKASFLTKVFLISAVRLRMVVLVEIYLDIVVSS